MTAVQGQALVLLVLGVVPAAGAGLAGLAWLSLLRFRCRIEVISGDGVLAVLDGILPPVPAVTGYLAGLELLAGRGWPGIALAALPGPVFPGLAPGQQQVMDELSRRVRAAARSCLTCGLPAALLGHLAPPARRPDRQEPDSPPDSRTDADASGHGPPATCRAAPRAQQAPARTAPARIDPHPERNSGQ
jgi:hypothetical protein